MVFLVRNFKYQMSSLEERVTEFYYIYTRSTKNEICLYIAIIILV